MRFQVYNHEDGIKGFKRLINAGKKSQIDLIKKLTTDTPPEFCIYKLLDTIE